MPRAAAVSQRDVVDWEDLALEEECIERLGRCVRGNWRRRREANRLGGRAAMAAAVNEDQWMGKSIGEGSS